MLRKIVSTRRKLAKVIQRAIPMKIELSKVLLGQQVGKRTTAQWCQDMGDPSLGSLQIKDWPHVKLLKQFKSMGETVFEPEVFWKTEYFKNAWSCIINYNYFTWCRTKEDILKAAKNFVYRTFDEGYNQQALSGSGGDKASPPGQPVIVRRVKASENLQACDGHHRLASAYVLGYKYITGHINIWPKVYTPIQELILDVDHQRGKENLWQPLPGIEEIKGWPQVQSSESVYKLINNYIDNEQIKTVFDSNCGYGWFLHKFKETGRQVRGIDRDPSALKIGKSVYKLTNDEIRRTTDYLLSSNSENFDLVLCINELENFLKKHRPISTQKYLESLTSITNKICFIDIPENRKEEVIPILDSLTGFQHTIIDEKVHFQAHTRLLICINRIQGGTS